MPPSRPLGIREFVRITRRFRQELVPAAALTAQRVLFLAGAISLVDKTGVNTGRTRGNWQFSMSGIPRSVLKRTDKGGGTVKAEAVSKSARARPFGVMIAANNMPHILLMEHGGYKPADPPTDEESLKRRAAGRSSVDRKRATLVGGSEGSPLVKGGFVISTPRGMVGVTIQELLVKADTIIRTATKSAKGKR